MKAIEIEILCR